MKDHPEMWFREMKRLRKKITELPHQDDLIVFYGSSTVRLWVNIRTDLHPLNVINMGFGGSSFRWLGYYFIELFSEIDPKTILFYGGENDLHHGAPPRQVYHDFLKLAHTAKSRFPEAQLHCISMKPSPSRKILENKIQETNRLLKQAIGEFEGDFIDIYHPMTAEKDGGLLDLFMKDQLHMNKKGYQIWTTVLRDFFDLPQS